MTCQFSLFGTLEKLTDQNINPLIQLTLNRYPETQVSNLQAWDAADEHLLNFLIESKIISKDVHANIAIINDNFGALSCSIKKYSPSSNIFIETDAKTSQLGIQGNLKQNKLIESNITWLTSHESLPSVPSLVLVKLPKNLTYFTDQLIRLSHILPQGFQIYISAKAKSISSSLLQLIEKYFGQANASLTWKKTRVITAIFDGKQRAKQQALNWSISEYQLNITNFSNVFAANKLDIGARVMLENMPKGEYKQIIDLGCGNGVLGLRAAQLWPQADIHFIDDSEIAVETSKYNWQHNHFPHDQGYFHWNDCLSDLKNNIDADLILCNPPFHQGEAITDHIAWQMFNDARKQLKSGGILHVVGNRHLGYHIKLTRLFGNCKTIASNGKFVILQSQRVY